MDKASNMCASATNSSALTSDPWVSSHSLIDWFIQLIHCFFNLHPYRQHSSKKSRLALRLSIDAYSPSVMLLAGLVHMCLCWETKKDYKIETWLALLLDENETVVRSTSSFCQQKKKDSPAGRNGILTHGTSDVTHSRNARSIIGR